MRYCDLSDFEVLSEIGKRSARARLNLNMTQGALAVEAGISVATVQRFEGGESIQLLKFIRILRVLDLLGNFDLLMPDVAVSPLQQVKLQGKQRKRASTSKTSSAEEWSWGDDK